jgi:hypothetical protein
LKDSIAYSGNPEIRFELLRQNSEYEPKFLQTEVPMKVYLYDVESGIFLGEDYFDTSEIGGVCKMPENATTVKPPELGKEQIAIFNVSAGIWEVKVKR